MPQSIWALVLALVPLAAGAKTIDQIIDVVKADIIGPLTTFFFVAATVIFLYGVVEFVMGSSFGETSSSGSISFKSREKGKQHIMWGIIGLVIMVAVQAIISIFQNFFAY
ncbi:MAG: hypothetical protein Q8P07_05845 [bacterium]|nr:hypothetical protein [bacterium]